MLVEREAKIMNFRKEKYYMAHILTDGMDAATGRIDEKEKADGIAGVCRNGQALITSVLKEEKAAAPPKLYDLTTLQRDANRLFGFTAKQTLEYTQSLYEKKLATYPRTDSQFLSDDMGQTAESVIDAVFSSLMFEENKASRPDIKRILNSKKVTDHHAIIPTMEIAKADLAALPETERKILSLTGKFRLDRFIQMLLPGGAQKAVRYQGQDFTLCFRKRRKVSFRNLHCGDNGMVVCHFLTVQNPLYIRSGSLIFLKHQGMEHRFDYALCGLPHVIRQKLAVRPRICG